jgi:hypothetical protein
VAIIAVKKTVFEKLGGQVNLEFWKTCYLED